jgi:hypothetical protein
MAQQPPAQVAALAQRFPGLVACCCMSYLQEGGEAAAAPAPAPGAPGRGGGSALPVEALPSTHADAAAPVRAGAAAAERGGACAAVPRITFLYKLVPGMADRSFGAHGAYFYPPWDEPRRCVARGRTAPVWRRLMLVLSRMTPGCTSARHTAVSAVANCAHLQPVSRRRSRHRT